MARWANCDFESLRKHAEQLEKLADNSDAALMEISKAIARRLERSLVKRTPTGVPPDYATEEAKREHWSGYVGGTLKKAWKVTIDRAGEDYVVTAVNPTEYASYVEYGHRQEPGRYVRALGLRLKASWVPGKFMMTLSVRDVEKVMPRIIERELYKCLKEAFGGDQ